MSNYNAPDAFNDLFFDFTGHVNAIYPSDKHSIAEDLAKTITERKENQKSGPLIIANSVGIYVYSDGPGHRLISSAEYRASPNSV